LCHDHPDILDTNLWITVGFTYHAEWQKYAVVRVSSKRDSCNVGLCLACMDYLHPSVSAFCLTCKAPRPLNWSTGNKQLDSFIRKSWDNVNTKADGHIQWIEYSRFENIQKSSSLEHNCTHTVIWQEPMAYGTRTRKVNLKKIVDGKDAQIFDFYTVNCLFQSVKHESHQLINDYTVETNCYSMQ
jgi:hypothetical protein